LRFIAAIRSLSYRGIIRNLKGHFEPFYKSQHRVSPEITLMYGLEAADKKYVPKRDVEGMRKKGKEALDRLLGLACQKGKIEYDGLLLFDPQNLPEWIHKNYPDLFAKYVESLGNESEAGNPDTKGK